MQINDVPVSDLWSELVCPECYGPKAREWGHCERCEPEARSSDPQERYAFLLLTRASEACSRLLNEVEELLGTEITPLWICDPDY
jgi:hypothetical protein